MIPRIPEILTDLIRTRWVLVIFGRERINVTALDFIRISLANRRRILVHARRLPAFGMVQDLIEQLMDGEREEGRVSVFRAEGLQHLFQTIVEIYHGCLPNLSRGGAFGGGLG